MRSLRSGKVNLVSTSVPSCLKVSSSDLRRASDFRHEASVFWQAPLPDTILRLFEAFEQVGIVVTEVFVIGIVVNLDRSEIRKLAFDLKESLGLIARRGNVGARKRQNQCPDKGSHVV